ncbi:unnamed protein product [Linum trigynum]|uniref:Uncharacterized protein n=1 Tax=Linum trigynum TaxID=586398 RepID=A0AAV2E1Z4_9ROSI
MSPCNSTQLHRSSPPFARPIAAESRRKENLFRCSSPLLRKKVAPSSSSSLLQAASSPSRKKVAAFHHRPSKLVVLIGPPSFVVTRGFHPSGCRWNMQGFAAWGEGG